MKKILVGLLAVAFVVPVSLLQGWSNKYKYLNNLPQDSKVKQECEQLWRSWGKQGEVETQCNSLDQQFNSYKRTFDLYQLEMGQSRINDVLVSINMFLETNEFLDRAEKSIDIILSDENSSIQNKEKVYIAKLLKAEVLLKK